MANVNIYKEQGGDKLVIEGGASMEVDGSTTTIKLKDDVVLSFGDADDASIEWNGTNFIVIGNLPTADPGVAGQWYSDSGAVTISSGV